MLTSLQCGRQIAQLKEEYEEAKKTLEAEAAKLRQVGTDEILRSGEGWERRAALQQVSLQRFSGGWGFRKHNFPFLFLQNVLSGLKDAGRHVEGAAERHTVAAHRRGAPDLKGSVHLPANSVAFMALLHGCFCYRGDGKTRQRRRHAGHRRQRGGKTGGQPVW